MPIGTLRGYNKEMESHPLSPGINRTARFFTSFVHLRCPHCGEGNIYQSWIVVHPVCLVCGARFERNSGTWTGPVVLGYAAAVMGAIVAAIALYMTVGFFDGFEYVLVAASLVSAVATYRPLKAAWIWLLWIAGLVFPDDPASRR